MEDMARLALVEQSFREPEKFKSVLKEILQFINTVLDNPHDEEPRNVKSDILKQNLHHEALVDYLKFIGFQVDNNNLQYPKENGLNSLKMAKASMERKFYFCCGSSSPAVVSLKAKKKSRLEPVNVLSTSNEFLLKIQSLFNTVLLYEDESLQDKARECIPLLKLQLMAIDRMREHQLKLKTGEIQGHDLSYDLALLMELMVWFKYKFFSWVDKPACRLCGGQTTHVGNIRAKRENEFCNVELYKCGGCGGGAEFARLNSPGALLTTRRGRCGEWANCFTLLCRALGYDARYVYDTTDHVWCEVFDFESYSWVHVDPCEAKLNAPLMYSHGWKKKLAYVIALSCDDLQDVTWRYTTQHSEVLKRRNLCSEKDLIRSIISLREQRQRLLTEPRRQFLTKRTVLELIQLMVEKTPTDYESYGRMSGSKEWRVARGESAPNSNKHTFQFSAPASYSVQYCSGTDKYKVFRDNSEICAIGQWSDGVYERKHVFRKVEEDWQMAYLAREEGESEGFVSWRFEAKDIKYVSIELKATTKVYENGEIVWSIQFDEEAPITVEIGEKPLKLAREFKMASVRAALRGGAGDAGWQHAQLFRRPAGDARAAFCVALVAE